QHVMKQRMAVVAAEPVAPVVRISAILRHSGFELHQSLIRPDAQIFSAQIEPGIALPGLNDTAAPAVSAVNPVIESPAQRVDAKLRIPFFESFKERLVKVRFAVAVAIFGVENLRRGRDDRAVAPSDDAG